MGTVQQIVTPPEADGWRLDKALGLVLAAVGLRGRRRLLEAGAVAVNGRSRPAAYRVRAGDRLVVTVMAEAQGPFTAADVPVLTDDGDYAAVCKPAGLHSAALAHGGGQSLEALLPVLFPGRPARLLSRLDQLTTGIVPVAFGVAAAAAYRRLEDAGHVAKTYLAVGHGVVTAPFVVASELDMADRAKTRVLRRTADDPLRHTRVEPVEAAGGLVLCRCRIAKGARHQIRAHMAASGHPLVGDPLYGRGEGQRLFLHCAVLETSVLTVSAPPPWSLADALAVIGPDA